MAFRVRIGWLRTIAAGLVMIVIVFLFVGALLGGVHRDSSTERLFAILLCGVLFGGVLLIAMGPARGGAGFVVASLAAWIAWAVIGAPGAVGSVAPWWGALALAAGLAWRGSA